MYWVAEQLHCSGVLAVVLGGLYLSNRRLEFLNSESRIQALNVWESFVFILNGIVFLIIGLDLPEIVDGMRASGTSVHTGINYGIMVTVILVLARLISAYSAMIATYLFRPGVMPSRSRKQVMLIPLTLGWSGMRGVVSLAAALAIPVTLENGMPFPQRNLILFITFTVILLTLVIQGLTLPLLIKYTGVFENLAVTGTSPEETRQQMKHGLKQHIYQFLKTKYDNEPNGNGGIEKMLRLWEERAKAAEDSGMTARNKAIFVELLESQRQYLTELNKDPNIDEGIIRAQLYQIDLEEERLKII